MTTQEFSIEFDILYNNISSDQAPGLTEYEKSVFLTQAQQDTVIAMYSGKLGEAFETTEEYSEYLRDIISEFEIDKPSGVLMYPRNKETGVSPVWFRVFESVVLKDSRLMCNGSDEREADVYPVSNDTFYRTSNSPFRDSNERRVLRLDVADGGFILKSKYDIGKYICRYIRKPKPIILEDLGDELTIDGSNKETPCELPDVLHRSILTRAVELAKAVWKS